KTSATREHATHKQRAAKARLAMIAGHFAGGLLGEGILGSSKTQPARCLLMIQRVLPTLPQFPTCCCSVGYFVCLLSEPFCDFAHLVKHFVSPFNGQAGLDDAAQALKNFVHGGSDIANFFFVLLLS